MSEAADILRQAKERFSETGGSVFGALDAVASRDEKRRTARQYLLDAAYEAGEPSVVALMGDKKKSLLFDRAITLAESQP